MGLTPKPCTCPTRDALDAMLCDAFKRRAAVEQALYDMAAGKLPMPDAAKLRELVREARAYSFDFLEWKRAGTLKAHWLAHTKRTCVRCQIPLVKAKELGRSRRRAFFCERCQKCYGDPTLVAVEAPRVEE